MKNSKLSHLLNSFKGYEFQLFKKFISSPFFNNKKEVIDLFNFILANQKRVSHILDIGKKEEAFQYVFPNKEFSAEKMRRLSSEMTLLIQQFFAVQEMKNNNVAEKKLLIDSFNKRNLSRRFINESEKLISKIKNETPNDIHSQLNLFLLTKELHFHQNNPKSTKDIQKVVDAQEHLDAFYFLSKLKLSCELVVRNNTFNNSIEIPLFDEIIKLSNAWKNNDNQLFQLYLMALDNLKNENNEESFLKFKELYFNNLSLLSEKERFSLFLIILNINGIMLNRGKSMNYSAQLELYKRALNEKILIVNNRITPESFTNIVVLAAHLKKFKWAENFVKNNSKYLDHNNAERSIAFSKGYISFRKGDYDEAIRMLWNCKFDLLPFDVRTKAIIVRALFEQFSANPDKYAFCWGQMETIERYFRRKKDLSENKSEAYINFIKTTKKIVTLKRKGKFNELEMKKLKTKINQEENLVAKPWLLQKLN